MAPESHESNLTTCSLSYGTKTLPGVYTDTNTRLEEYQTSKGGICRYDSGGVQ